MLLLIFVGATVRVTGSGMGCPDWPTCWGCLIPPSSVDQVDFEALPIERFQRKAERMGRDPGSITVATTQSIKQIQNGDWVTVWPRDRAAAPLKGP